MKRTWIVVLLAFASTMNGEASRPECAKETLQQVPKGAMPTLGRPTETTDTTVSISSTANASLICSNHLTRAVDQVGETASNRASAAPTIPKTPIRRMMKSRASRRSATTWAACSISSARFHRQAQEIAES